MSDSVRAIFSRTSSNQHESTAPIAPSSRHALTGYTRLIREEATTFRAPTPPTDRGRLRPAASEEARAQWCQKLKPRRSFDKDIKLTSILQVDGSLLTGSNNFRHEFHHRTSQLTGCGFFQYIYLRCNFFVLVIANLQSAVLLAVRHLVGQPAPEIIYFH